MATVGLFHGERRPVQEEAMPCTAVAEEAGAATLARGKAGGVAAKKKKANGGGASGGGQGEDVVPNPLFESMDLMLKQMSQMEGRGGWGASVEEAASTPP